MAPKKMPPKKGGDGPKQPPLIGRFGTSLKIGIVGLPNVGKSTFFNVLTKSEAAAENFPFCTIDPNESRVPIPDERFDFLSQYHKPASKVPAFLNVVDIAGLVKGAHAGQGLGNAFLSHISACDAIFHMTRLLPDCDCQEINSPVSSLQLAKIKEWVDIHDPGALVIPFSGGFESKYQDMTDEEKQKYCEENKTQSVLTKIIKSGYAALQLEYFFTAGPDEVRAWTIRKGTKAPQAAGKIHTDFEKGFIMAEVMKFADFKEEGNENAVKAAGKYRQQGRNYIVEDGDIIFFKFNTPNQPKKK
ncbi:obg-like ATPase 1 [Sinocyclocheilus rhinocerous]|uniref:obg-like ATPase 1 n=1 Tax=Sinocyclocheilus rhinocerous TaxID=307959 RepID=UPI0007B94E7E|nr:PREDICTED: obg-like ATPase 1 [Sinocyclocheilus rhinocerous]